MLRFHRSDTAQKIVAKSDIATLTAYTAPFSENIIPFTAMPFNIVSSHIHMVLSLFLLKTVDFASF